MELIRLAQHLMSRGGANQAIEYVEHALVLKPDSQVGPFNIKPVTTEAIFGEDKQQFVILFPSEAIIWREGNSQLWLRGRGSLMTEQRWGKLQQRAGNADLF